jgi:starch synthase (maltosyl-transferring)
MGRHFHVNGITVNKTTQTVESAAACGVFHMADVSPPIDGGGIENRIPAERCPLGWGGIRPRIDPVRDPALRFRCLARGAR